MRLIEFEDAFTGCSETGRNISFLVFNPPILVATRSKMWVCGRVITGIVDSKLDGCMNVCLFSEFCECYKLEVSATGRSIIQRIPTLRGVSERDLDNSTMRRPTYNQEGCRAKKGKAFKLLT
jgi:hypothetical protein